MKREIKFRAWDGEKMIFRGLHDRNWYTDEKSGKAVKGIHPSDNHFLKVMQSTGLHDKNGKEIYEGDILKADNWAVHWVVQFDKVKARFNCIINKEWSINDYIPTRVVAVIGNIHETPQP